MTDIVKSTRLTLRRHCVEFPDERTSNPERAAQLTDADLTADVLSLLVVVILPHGKPSIPLQGVQVDAVNGTQPQIVAQTSDGNPISTGIGVS